MTKHCNPLQTASHRHVHTHMTHTKISDCIDFNAMLLPQLWPLIWPCLEKQDSRHYYPPKKCDACHDSNGIYLSVRFYFTWHKSVTASCLSCAHQVPPVGWVRADITHCPCVEFIFDGVFSKIAFYADSSRNLPRIAWWAQRTSEEASATQEHFLSASTSRWPRFMGKLLPSSKSSINCELFIKINKTTGKLH